MRVAIAYGRLRLQVGAMKSHKYNRELPPPALFVEYGNESDEDNDLDVPPTSGQQYLRRVQLEASKCPDVVVANIDRSNFANKQTVVVPDSNGCAPAPAGFTASLQWQAEQISNFSEIRMAVVRYKARNCSRQPRPVAQLPGFNDEVGWCNFCFGSHLQRELARLNDNFAKRKPANENSAGVLPLLSIVTLMSQTLLEQILGYHVGWLEATGFTAEQGRWLYAILACLMKPLTPEICALLRNLARNCTNLRAALQSPEDPKLVQLNLLLCLVARYFDQSDLADSSTQ